MTKQAPGRAATRCPSGLCVDLEEHVGGRWVPAVSREQYVNLDARVLRSTGPHPEHGRVVRLRGRVTRGRRGVGGIRLRWTLTRDPHNLGRASEAGLGAALANTLEATTDGAGHTPAVELTLSECGGDVFDVELAPVSPLPSPVPPPGRVRYTVWRKLFFIATHMIDAAGGDSLAIHDADFAALQAELADPTRGVFIRLVKRAIPRPLRLPYRPHLVSGRERVGPFTDGLFRVDPEVEPFVLRFIGVRVVEDPVAAHDAIYDDGFSPAPSAGPPWYSQPFVPIADVPHPDDYVDFTHGTSTTRVLPGRRERSAPLGPLSEWRFEPYATTTREPGLPRGVRLRMESTHRPDFLHFHVRAHAILGVTFGAGSAAEASPPQFAIIAVPVGLLRALQDPGAKRRALMRNVLVHEVGHALGLTGRPPPFLPSRPEGHCEDRSCVASSGAGPLSGRHFCDRPSGPVPPAPRPWPYCRWNLRRQPLTRAVLRAVWRR